MQLIDDIRRWECRRFADAWQGWRGGNLVPQRRDVHIENIAGLLHLVSVIKIVSPDEANFRLASTALCQAMGIELTGLNYFDFTTPEERDARAVRTCKLVDHPCGSHFLFPILYRTGRTVPTEESDQLPLPEGFQFIDIGAGVPDPGLGLDDRQPAELSQRRTGC